VFPVLLAASKGNGPLYVNAVLGQLESNRASFGVSAPGTLSLEADRGALEYLEPSETEFTVLYDGVPLPGGSEVALTALDPSKLLGLPESSVTDSAGRIAVPALEAAWPEGPLGVKAAALGNESPPLGFGVLLGGGLALHASRGALGLYEPRETGLTVSYRGKELAEGVPVGFVFDPREIGGLASSAVTGPGGTVTADLEALAASGPVGVKAALGGIESPAAVFSVEIGGTLSLEASRDALELFEPRLTEFTVKLNGRELPEGTPVGFDFDPGELDWPGGESGPLATDGDGRVAAGLASLVPEGPVEVSASLGALRSGKVAFDVELLSAHMVMTWILDPKDSEMTGGGFEEYTVHPCEPYDGVLSFEYRERPLADAALWGRGVGLPEEGTEFSTGPDGKIGMVLVHRGGSAEEYFEDPWWHVRVGNSPEMLIRGPYPTGFKPC
ncbi:MAG: DUF3540 domain-containing protein, partial [Deltaproteobacteria bacterium]|nr:DUF3540 domain-containing protein [Deltaproteobacteria bacterium]